MSDLSIESLFHIGDYVTIDGSSKGWLVDKIGTGLETKFKVRYELSNVHESNIGLDRISVTVIPQLNSRRSDSNQSDSNSNNSDRSSDDQDNSSDIQNTQTLASPNNLQTFKSLLHGAFVFDTFNKVTNMRLFTYLKDGMSNTRGWLRSVLQQKPVNPRVHMTQSENHVMLVLGSLFCGLTPRNGPFRGYVASICHAFGVTRFTTYDSMTKFIQSDFQMTRKERNDKGKTIFNCERKRKNTFTAFNVFKNVNVHRSEKLLLESLNSYSKMNTKTYLKKKSEHTRYLLNAIMIVQNTYGTN